LRICGRVGLGRSSTAERPETALAAAEFDQSLACVRRATCSAAQAWNCPNRASGDDGSLFSVLVWQASSETAAISCVGDNASGSAGDRIADVGIIGAIDLHQAEAPI
jgi:hypothetical protein